MRMESRHYAEQWRMQKGLRVKTADKHKNFFHYNDYRPSVCIGLKLSLCLSFCGNGMCVRAHVPLPILYCENVH